MPQNTKENAQLTKLQNQFRGLVASLRDSHFSAEKGAPTAQQYSSGLKDIFFAARLALPASRYGEFISWVDKQETTILLDVSNAQKSYEP